MLVGLLPFGLLQPCNGFWGADFFYWRGTVKDRGKLQDVLPSSIVAQILLFPIFSTKPDTILWASDHDGFFICGQRRSLYVVLGQEMRVFRLSASRAFFYGDYCMVIWLLMTPYV